jgi:hypothetical protein
MADPHKTVESVSEAAAIRAVLPRHTVKRLAHLLGLPLGTAHEWVYRRVPQRAISGDRADALIAECDRLSLVIAAARRHWAEARDEAGGVVAGRKAAEAGAPADRMGPALSGASPTNPAGS